MKNISGREQLNIYVNSPKQRGLTEIQFKNSEFTKVDSCDDLFNIYIEIENKKINLARFQGNGCAISFASTEAILNLIEGKTIDDANNIIKMYEDFLFNKSNKIHKNLSIFKIVRTHVSRRKCALASIEIVRKVINL
ncbi:MAG: iron-sulfur cluster assembly scaffold protein [Mycoplasmataceae bacterium]|nr:iron-sulfur cluster assembly scaffold protein [Mycoplasmataceae bacterium]